MVGSLRAGVALDAGARRRRRRSARSCTWTQGTEPLRGPGQTLVGLAFSLAMGLWVTRVLEQSAQRAALIRGAGVAPAPSWPRLHHEQGVARRAGAAGARGARHPGAGLHEHRRAGPDRGRRAARRSRRGGRAAGADRGGRPGEPGRGPGDGRPRSRRSRWTPRRWSRRCTGWPSGSAGRPGWPPGSTPRRWTARHGADPGRGGRAAARRAGGAGQRAAARVGDARWCCGSAGRSATCRCRCTWRTTGWASTRPRSAGRGPGRAARPGRGGRAARWTSPRRRGRGPG